MPANWSHCQPIWTTCPPDHYFYPLHQDNRRQCHLGMQHTIYIPCTSCQIWIFCVSLSEDSNNRFIVTFDHNFLTCPLFTEESNNKKDINHFKLHNQTIPIVTLYGKMVYPVLIYLFFYLGFYIAFNTVQVISRRVVGRAEEISTYSS